MGRKSSAKKASLPCSCGSGRKMKNCCGVGPQAMEFDSLPLSTQDLLRETQKKYIDEYQKYGAVGSPISFIKNGVRYVAVGNESVPFDPKMTYLDFLGNYMKTVTGKEWGNEELAKPEKDQHQIIKLYRKVVDIQKSAVRTAPGIYSLDRTGSVQAWFQLSYDLHVVSHYFALHESVLRRLKNKDQYQGARYELSVTAAIIRAGFEELEHQDEKDRTSYHFEFTATHSKTREKISFEAKSKHRAGVLGYPGVSIEGDQKANIKYILGDALKKPSKYPLAIFVDLNLPPADKESQRTILTKELNKAISNKEKQYADGMPANVIFLTNHPHHYENAENPNPFIKTSLSTPPTSRG